MIPFAQQQLASRQGRCSGHVRCNPAQAPAPRPFAAPPVALRLYARLVDEHARIRRQARKRQADVVVNLRNLAHRLGHLQRA